MRRCRFIWAARRQTTNTTRRAGVTGLENQCSSEGVGQRKGSVRCTFQALYTRSGVSSQTAASLNETGLGFARSHVPSQMLSFSDWIATLSLVFGGCCRCAPERDDVLCPRLSSLTATQSQQSDSPLRTPTQASSSPSFSSSSSPSTHSPASLPSLSPSRLPRTRNSTETVVMRNPARSRRGFLG